MSVPPTNKVLKVMNRMRSMTAAASFHSFFLSSSSSATSRSSDSFRNCARRRLRISTSSLSVVPNVISTASTLFFLLPTGDGVAGFNEGFMRRQDASFIHMSHFTCPHTTDDIQSNNSTDSRPAHTTRVHEPCSRPVNTGVILDTHDNGCVGNPRYCRRPTSIK